MTLLLATVCSASETRAKSSRQAQAYHRASFAQHSRSPFAVVIRRHFFFCEELN